MVATISTIVLLFGWIIQIKWITNLAPQLAAMVPSTALSLLFISTLTYKLSLAKRQRASFYDYLKIGIVVSSSLTNLIMYSYGLHAGIDGLFIFELAKDGKEEMAVSTAICLLFSSACLALLFNRSNLNYWGIIILSGFGLFFTVFALIGYVIDVKFLYSSFIFKAMAIHTAFSLMILFCAFLCLCNWR